MKEPYEVQGLRETYKFNSNQSLKCLSYTRLPQCIQRRKDSGFASLQTTWVLRRLSKSLSGSRDGREADKPPNTLNTVRL